MADFLAALCFPLGILAVGLAVAWRQAEAAVDRCLVGWQEAGQLRLAAEKEVAAEREKRLAAEASLADLRAKAGQARELLGG